MISLTYFCKCGWRSPVLDNAQAHADTTGHVVTVTGSITSTKTFDAKQIAKTAAEKAREAAILRAARDRGLL